MDIKKKHAASRRECMIVKYKTFQTNGNFFLFKFVACTCYPLANRFGLAMCPAKLSHPPSFPFIVSIAKRIQA